MAWSALYSSTEQLAYEAVLPAVRRSDNMADSGPLILVAEDDRITRMKLVRFLERELSARVLAADNGNMAWEIYQEHPEIQFVISDWVMPDCTGVELCERIRGAAGRRYTYFILLSGRA
jgi:sigma-B regulation protein RsbU (phosphoserine phosphatase)